MATRKHPALTDAQKGDICARHELGQSNRKIADALAIPQSTIHALLTRVKNRGSIENKQRPGRPRKSIDRDDRLLVRTALIKTRIPLRELKVEANSNLSVSTIRSRLKEENISKHRAAERARLTKSHIERRFKWAK
jgi:transposase